MCRCCTLSTLVRRSKNNSEKGNTALVHARPPRLLGRGRGVIRACAARGVLGRRKRRRLRGEELQDLGAPGPRGHGQDCLGVEPGRAQGAGPARGQRLRFREPRGPASCASSDTTLRLYRG